MNILMMGRYPHFFVALSPQEFEEDQILAARQPDLTRMSGTQSNLFSDCVPMFSFISMLSTIL